MKTLEQTIKDIFLGRKVRLNIKAKVMRETGVINDVKVNIPNENISMYDNFEIVLFHSEVANGCGLSTSISLEDEIEIF